MDLTFKFNIFVFMISLSPIFQVYILLNNLISFLFPKSLELFSTPKNTPPILKNSKMSYREIFWGTPSNTVGLVDIFKSGQEWSHMRDFIYIKCCAKGFFSEISDDKWLLKIV